uniref:Uncharacterized protein n=1 Tax=Moniliophthora roreri TaxID=221103 RepID=A0A0W0G1A4_MONRR
MHIPVQIVFLFNGKQKLKIPLAKSISVHQE